MFSNVIIKCMYIYFESIYTIILIFNYFIKHIRMSFSLNAYENRSLYIRWKFMTFESLTRSSFVKITIVPFVWTSIRYINPLCSWLPLKPARAVCKVRGLTLLLRVGTRWRCGDGLFSEVPPLEIDIVLTTLHPLLENVLQTVDHFEIPCLGAPFSWLEKPRNLNWILYSPWIKWIGGTH
jgi:hypothetical protein